MKVMPWTLALLVGICSLGSVFGATEYPTSYPFMNEAMVPPALLDATPVPDKVLTEEDPGGYTLRFITCDPYSQDRVGCDPDGGKCLPGFASCLGHFHIHSTKGTASKYMAQKNCSADAEYTPIAAPYDDFDPCPGCCKGVGYDGTPTSKGDYTKSLGKQAKNNERDLCEPFTSHEGAFCRFMFGSFFECQEYVPEESNKRSVVAPCFDSAYIYLRSCKLNQDGSSFVSKNKQEPASYKALLSVDQMYVVQALFLGGDRVCKPYSYFYPESAVESPTTGSSSVRGVVECLTLFLLGHFNI